MSLKSNANPFGDHFYFRDFDGGLTFPRIPETEVFCCFSTSLLVFGGLGKRGCYVAGEICIGNGFQGGGV